jgi:hypothetical protein
MHVMKFKIRDCICRKGGDFEALRGRDRNNEITSQITSEIDIEYGNNLCSEVQLRTILQMR